MDPIPPRSIVVAELSRLYERRARSMRRRLRRMGIRPEDARELVQDAFVTALERWRDAPRGAKLRREWVEGIAWQRAMNFLRLLRHRREACAEAEVRRAASPGSDVESRAHARALTRTMLEPMREADRALFLAYFVEGSTLDELAERQGRSRDALFRRISALRRGAVERVGHAHFE